jgi:hypothetical protein
LVRLVEFVVCNPHTMTWGVQLQVFQRSFSVKEQGRGTGTHSVKLLMKEYLKGEVSFENVMNETVFRVSLPMVILKMYTCSDERR